MPKGQSLTAQQERFDHGACPIHGEGMTQVGNGYYPVIGGSYTIVGCPRRDCQVRAKEFHREGPWALLLPLPAGIHPGVTPVERITPEEMLMAACDTVTVDVRVFVGDSGQGIESCIALVLDGDIYRIGDGGDALRLIMKLSDAQKALAQFRERANAPQGSSIAPS
jgi:hypothetical protein